MVFQIVAAILKQDIEVQLIDLLAGEQKQEWFLKMNPKHQVPLLAVDEKTFISESVVICQYLCKIAGKNSLYPGKCWYIDTCDLFQCTYGEKSIKKSFLEDPLKQAKIDEAIVDASNLKFFYFVMVKILGKPESAKGLKEAEESFKTLNDLRFKVG